MLRVRNIGIKFVYGLMSIFLFVILVNAIFFVSSIRTDYKINPVALIISVIFVYIFIQFVLSPILKRYSTQFNIVCWVLIILFQLLLAFKYQGAGGVDDFDIRMQMATFLNGHGALAHYFIYAANNIPITLIFTVIAKIGGVLGIKNITLLLNIYQCVLIDLAILAITFILDKENKKSQASYLLLLFILYSPISVFGVNIYTDVTSSCFAIYGALLFYIYLKKNKNYLLVLSGILEAAAYLTKMNLIIMTISIVIIIIISEYKPLEKVKVLSIFALSFVLIVGIYNVGVTKLQNRSYTSEQISESSFPYTYWISMGLNTKTYGENSFYNVNLYGEGAQQKTLQNRKKYYSAKIKSQIKNEGAKGLAKLYLAKSNVMYSQGELGTVERSFGISKNMEGVYQYIAGKRNYGYAFYSQVIYVFILITALLYSIKQTLKSSTVRIGYFEIITVFFVGIFLFHILMWEVMPRYAFVAIFALMPVSAAGGTNDPLPQFLKNSYKVPYMIGIICLILLLVQLPATKKMGQRKTQINSQSVLSQNFPDHSLVALSIPKNRAIKEKIDVRSKFRKINLASWAGGKTIEENPNLQLRIYKVNGNKKHYVVNDNVLKQAGEYVIEVKNISNKETQIATGYTYPVDLLQKHIENHPNYYFSFNVTR
jgi:4-amino-4-deoxy-L-arabinose transferase-like glycosyltransferase